MNDVKFLYGPVPSRRLGRSLGISPIPAKDLHLCLHLLPVGAYNDADEQACDVVSSRTDHRQIWGCPQSSCSFDTVTVAGQGEPTLYLGIGDLIAALQERTTAPIAVITNGMLLGDMDVRKGLQGADIVLPTLAAFDKTSFGSIHRSDQALQFSGVIQGLKEFSKTYSGELWLEVMLMDGINDDDASLQRIAEQLEGIHYDKLDINTPVRPPAEPYVQEISAARMRAAVEILGGIPTA